MILAYLSSANGGKLQRDEAESTATCAWLLNNARSGGD